MSDVRLAVIGCGHLGRIHAQLVTELEDVQLVGVVDPQPAARQQVADRCRTLGVADIRQLLGQIDAAVIAAPTPLHHDLTCLLLDQGVHVLVEKPIGCSTAEADRMIHAARAANRVLQVGHVERFNPAYQAACPFINQPRYLQAIRSGPFSFRSMDVGVVLDLMIHDLDLILAMVKSPVVSIEAYGQSLITEFEDFAHARLTFANGSVASVTASRMAQTAQRSLQICQGTQQILLDLQQRTAEIVEAGPGLAAVLGDAPVPAAGPERDVLLSQVLPVESLLVPAQNALLEELREFVRCVRYQQAPTVGGQDGRDALKLAERILQRLQSQALFTGDSAAAA